MIQDDLPICWLGCDSICTLNSPCSLVGTKTDPQVLGLGGGHLGGEGCCIILPTQSSSHFLSVSAATLMYLIPALKCVRFLVNLPLVCTYSMGISGIVLCSITGIVLTFFIRHYVFKVLQVVLDTEFDAANNCTLVCLSTPPPTPCLSLLHSKQSHDRPPRSGHHGPVQDFLRKTH